MYQRKTQHEIQMIFTHPWIPRVHLWLCEVHVKYHYIHWAHEQWCPLFLLHSQPPCIVYLHMVFKALNFPAKSIYYNRAVQLQTTEGPAVYQISTWGPRYKEKFISNIPIQISALQWADPWSTNTQTTTGQKNSPTQ
jgi:hypothetical protein